MAEVQVDRGAFRVAYSQKHREDYAKLTPQQMLAFHDVVLDLTLDPHRFPERVTQVAGGSFLYRHPNPPIELKFAVDEQTRTICFDDVYGETSLGPLVVICYSRKDKKWLDEILATLRPLVRNELMRIWADVDIEAGEEWRKEIDRFFGAARFAILLVSRHFLESDFIAWNELPRLAESARKGRIRLLWIVVGECAWEDVPELEARQKLNLRRPLNSLTEPELDEALKDIYEAIQKAANAEDERSTASPVDGGRAAGVASGP